MDMDSVQAENFDQENDIEFWIREVEAELKEIDRQQHQLIRDRTKYEGTLLWLKKLHESQN